MSGHAAHFKHLAQILRESKQPTHYNFVRMQLALAHRVSETQRRAPRTHAKRAALSHNSHSRPFVSFDPPAQRILN